MVKYADLEASVAVTLDPVLGDKSPQNEENKTKEDGDKNDNTGR